MKRLSCLFKPPSPSPSPFLSSTTPPRSTLINHHPCAQYIFILLSLLCMLIILNMCHHHNTAALPSLSHAWSHRPPCPKLCLSHAIGSILMTGAYILKGSCGLIYSYSRALLHKALCQRRLGPVKPRRASLACHCLHPRRRRRHTTDVAPASTS